MCLVIQSVCHCLIDTCVSNTTAISQCNHLQHSVPFQDFALKTSPFFCYLELECALPRVTTTNWIRLPREIVDSSHAAYRYFSDHCCRALWMKYSFMIQTSQDSSQPL